MGGMIAQVYYNGSKWLTASIPISKGKVGCKLGHNGCVHFRKGSSKMKLTAARRKSIVAEHQKHLQPGESRCKLHCVSWKKKLEMCN